MQDYTRRTFMKIAGTTVATVTLGSALAACTQGSSTPDSGAEEATPSQVIVAINTTSEPSGGFDPLFAWGSGEHVHEPLIQSTLINTTSSMDFTNDLAKDYSCSEDGLVWTFTIRNDVCFTDGTPLTAKDVAFTINGIRDSEAAVADLSMVKEAVALDDETVELRLTKPFNALLYTLAVVGIVPEHAYGADYGSNPLGSGRYMLEQWDKGQQIIFVANPNYYGTAPKIERVVVVFMEEAAALAAVNAGQVDIAYTSATYSNQSVPGFELFACSTVDSRGISLPTLAPGGTKQEGESTYSTGNAVTSQLAMRRAINYAVDREALINNVLNGYGTAAYSVSDNMPWTSEDMQVTTSLDKAAEILASDGWKAGDDGILVKEGTRAAFELWYPANDTVRQALAMEFSNQLKNLGIEVTPRGGSWDELYPQQYANPILWGWGSNSPLEVYHLNYSTGWGNYACYENSVIDAYLDEALAQTAIEDSYEFWQKAQWDGTEGIAPAGAATWVWLANVDHLYFKRATLGVAEQKPHPHGHGWSLLNNVDQWQWL